MPNARIPVPAGPTTDPPERRGAARQSAGVLRAADGRLYVGDADGHLWRVHYTRWDADRRRHRAVPDASLATHLLFVRHDGAKRSAPIPVGTGHRLEDGAVAAYLDAAAWLPRDADPTAAGPAAAPGPERSSTLYNASRRAVQEGWPR